MFEKNQERKVKRIFQKAKFNDITNYVCRVMQSIADAGINDNSSKQYWSAYRWGKQVLRMNLQTILDNNKDIVSKQVLWEEYRKYSDRFDLVEKRVNSKIDAYLEERLMNMQEEYVFAIDVDSVLRDNLGEMVKLYNEEFNENMSVEDIKNYKTDVSFPRIEDETGKTSSQWFFQDHSEELFVEAKPFEHASEDIAELRKLGKVIIVTYQKTKLNKQQTLDWLEKNHIEYDGIVFAKDKSIVECDYFIDDNDWNFNGCRARQGILINAPYNKDVNLVELKKNTHCKDIERFNSLHEFVLDLKNNN